MCLEGVQNRNSHLIKGASKKKHLFHYVTCTAKCLYTILYLTRKDFMGEVASKMRCKEFGHTNMGCKRF